MSTRSKTWSARNGSTRRSPRACRRSWRPLKAAGPRPHHLPVPATPFVGREAELARIDAMLRDTQCRLISLVGLGGSGKTRLAIQAATQAVAQGADARDPSHLADGAYFVDLASVSTLEAVVSAMADALRMSFYVRPGSSLGLDAAQAQLLRYLAGKEALLVLDNVEQLLAQRQVAGPFVEWIAALLEAAPGVRLIVTSRERLNLPGEWVLEVAGLPFPGDCGDESVSEYAAVQLFVQGARRAGSFAADAIRLAGDRPHLPVGRRPAAGRGNGRRLDQGPVMPRDRCRPGAQSAGLDRRRGARFRSGTARCAPSATIRGACCRTRSATSLAGWPFSAAAFPGRPPPRSPALLFALLGSLIDKSLLRRSPEGRYELHPVLRQYAAERLAADPATYAETRARHACYYAAWLSLMNEQLKGSEQLAALAALRVETPNLHDAWRWLIEQRDLERLHGLLPAIVLFHDMGGRPAGSPRGRPPAAGHAARPGARFRRRCARWDARCLGCDGPGGREPAGLHTGRPAPFQPDSRSRGADERVPAGKPGPRATAARGRARL